MKNYLKVFAVLFAVSMVIFSCKGPEGPAGPAGTDGVDGIDGINGTDGTDGVDGNVTCLVCHSANAKNLIHNQYAASGHAIGETTALRAWGSGCAPCHSHELYVQYALTGSGDGAGGTMGRIDCSTCHDLHNTFEATDYAFRMAGADTAFAGSFVFDNGNSNVCTHCHQARRPYTDYLVAGEDSADITSTHAGPHHGPQGGLVAGNVGTETGNPHTFHGGANGWCVNCHMGSETGQGGHTFYPEVANCNVTGCHTGFTDFNYGGWIDDFDARMAEIQDSLVARGIYDDVNEHVITGKHQLDIYKAWWNWDVLLEDKSHGIHNPSYTNTLLNQAETALGI